MEFGQMVTNVVIIGHVDHGKSTLVGRLLSDTKSVPETLITKVQSACDMKGKQFEYAYLLDALQEEQEQGVTIDITKTPFVYGGKEYMLIDAPGHKQFIKNMVSGAALADVALLLIDAKEGLQEQTRKHAHIISLLGIKNVVVLVNKMDLIGYDQEKYHSICDQVGEYIRKLGIPSFAFLPISAKLGENILTLSENLSWYNGASLMDTLHKQTVQKQIISDLRLPVQDVYKFDQNRVIVGKIEAGTLSVGDKIIVYPSGEETYVSEIKSWHEKDNRSMYGVGENVAINIRDDLFVNRGNIICVGKPKISNFIQCTAFWLSSNSLVSGKKYILRMLTQDVTVTVHSVDKIYDSETLGTIRDKEVRQNSIAELTLKTEKPLVYEYFNQHNTLGRFVLVEDGVISGGGIIQPLDSILEERGDIKTKSNLTSPSCQAVNIQDRVQRYGHSNKVVWVTGLPKSGYSVLGQTLEEKLFRSGINVYHLNSSTNRFALNQDLSYSEADITENVRRLAEVANILSDVGLVVIVSCVSASRSDRENAKKIIGEDKFVEVFLDAEVEECIANDKNGVYDSEDISDQKDYIYQRSLYPHFVISSQYDHKHVEKLLEMINVKS